MNAMAKLELTIPMPKIARVEALDDLVIRVEWSAGIRVGRTDVVDLSPMINTLKLYRPIRDNQSLFRTIHLIENGRIVAWGDSDQIDMAADSVEELAEETMAPDDLRNFLRSNNLTQGEAAALLDRSRRQIANYLSGSEPIPRGFVLSCYGLMARKQILQGPLANIYGKALIQPIDTITSAGVSIEPVSLTQVPNGAMPTKTNVSSAV